MRLGTDLFDERAMLAERYLGESLWHELQGRADEAQVYALRAALIAGELRRSAGL